MIVLREARGVHVVSAQQVNELVRNHALPLKSLGLGVIHEDPAGDALEPDRRLRIPGRHRPIGG